MAALDALSVLVQSPPLLVAGLSGLGIISGSLALGLRHGIDWDHIAAITDITSSSTAVGPAEEGLLREPGIMLTDESHHTLQSVVVAAVGGPVLAGAAVPGGGSLAATLPMRSGFAAPGPRRTAFALGMMYAIGHATMVVVLGMAAILFSSVLPAWVDPIMERVVGVTLLLLAAYLFYSLYRFYRGGGEFRLRSRWMLVFAGAGRAYSWAMHRVRGQRGHHHHHYHGDRPDRYGPVTAYSIGLIHGVGAETGTQALIIATAVGAGSKASGIAALMAFTGGLIVSNAAVTIMSLSGFASSQRRQQVYVAVGLLAAVFSLVIGLVFLFRAGGVLPDLDAAVRWIGGPGS